MNSRARNCDMQRIWHHWETWECYRNGFYGSTPPAGVSKDDVLSMYAEFLKNSKRFRSAAYRVLSEWPVSCEQSLSNQGINRIAWVGQASMCIATGVPSCYRAGFKLLTPAQQRKANAVAQKVVERWERDIYPQMRLPL